jgi:Cof subfamily protein (haloacid dehalogenase superfamily)
MKQYKMICLDIDGTLVNSKHQVTDKTKRVVKRVADKIGIPVILVSARPPRGIFFLQEELNIVQPIICYSGALIVERPSKILFNVIIEASYVKKIYDIAKEENIHVSIYKDDKWYVEILDKWALQEGEITNSLPEVSVYNDLLGKWEVEGTGPNKILCMGEPEQIEALNTKLKEEGFDLNIYPSKPAYLEIMPKGASKTSAIEFLRGRYSAAQSEIVAIGDNYNDVDMIKYAGLGIAMGNAPEKVKLQADEVTLSNDEEGVAVAIEKHFF